MTIRKAARLVAAKARSSRWRITYSIDFRALALSGRTMSPRPWRRRTHPINDTLTIESPRPAIWALLRSIYLPKYKIPACRTCLA
jgi:hypothetical protein